MPVEVEESTGFHVFELHAPTAGVSILTLVVALIAIALAYGCYKKCCGIGFGLPGRNTAYPWYPMQPMGPVLQQAPPAAPPAQVAANLPPNSNEAAMQSIINMVALQALRNQVVTPPLALEPPSIQREPPGAIYALPEDRQHVGAPSRPSAPPTATPVDKAKSAVLASL